MTDTKLKGNFSVDLLFVRSVRKTCIQGDTKNLSLWEGLQTFATNGKLITKDGISNLFGVQFDFLLKARRVEYEVSGFWQCQNEITG